MPRTGRPRQFDREEALGAAMELFWRQGYETTSLDQLKAAMGALSSASFYAAFGSKEALYREALARYLDTHGQAVAPLYDEAVPPRDALELALRASARLQTDADRPTGCMVVLSAANGSPTIAPLQALVAGERRRNREAIAACVRRAVAAGELRAGADTEGLAALADALLVGMSVQARDGLCAPVIDAAVSSLLQLWDANRIDRWPGEG